MRKRVPHPGPWKLDCSLSRSNMALPHWTMVYELQSPDSRAPQAFVVEVFSELKQQTIQQRWRDINAILRILKGTGTKSRLS